MSLKTLFITVVFGHLLCLSYALSDISSSAFCTICECDNTLNDVLCTKEIAHYNIFNETKFWRNETVNQTYDYRRISIHHSGIGVISTIPESPVRILDLGSNRIQVIEDGSFRNLQNMVELVLSNNQLNSKSLGQNTLLGLYMPGEYQPLKSLKVLRLDGNDIHTLHQDFFEHTPHIEVLDLHGNPLKYIDVGTKVALGELQGLKFFDLSYANLSRIPQTLLHTLKNIEVLNLTGNELTAVPKTFKDATKLHYLSMDNNPIEFINETTGFPPMPGLKILHLCNMPNLTHIYAHSMCGLVNLEELYINNNNKLVHVDGQALSEKGKNVDSVTWPNIKKLYLRNNMLSYLESNFLPHWDQLEDLDIRDNPWACECETQWMTDTLIKVVAKININKTKNVDCGSPSEMAEKSLYDLSKENTSLRCLDYYGNMPEKDTSILIGIFVGLLIAIPMMLGLWFLYQRKCFGFFETGPASYSRKFYNRASPEDAEF